MKQTCTPHFEATCSASLYQSDYFFFAIDQDLDHQEMMRLDTNEDYSFETYEALMPYSYMENKLEKTLQKNLLKQKRRTMNLLMLSLTR